MVSDEKQAKKSKRSSTTNLPWSEKYRPRSVSELLGQKKIRARLEYYINRYRKGKADQPHLLFTGPPGTGKTSAAHAHCRDLFGEGYMQFVLDLNASDERGIDVIRGRIKKFAEAGSLGEKFNVIILDEADHLTADAQAALRRTMEKFSRNCRFILCANYPSRVIAPLRDRCTAFLFRPIPDKVALEALKKVCTKEGLKFDDSGVQALWQNSGGSLRKALNLLQGVGPEVRADLVKDKDFGLVGRALALLGKGNVHEAEKMILVAIRNGASPDDVYMTAYDAIRDGPADEARKTRALFTIGEYEYRTATGGNFEVQARCMLRHLRDIQGRVS